MLAQVFQVVYMYYIATRSAEECTEMIPILTQFQSYTILPIHNLWEKKSWYGIINDKTT